MSRYTLIYPGLCCFCAQNEQLPVTSRVLQWISAPKLKLHTNQHLKDIVWPIKCPHPLCEATVKDVASFNHHMVDYHGKKLYSHPFTSKPKEFYQSTVAERTLRSAGRYDGLQSQVWKSWDKYYPGTSVFRAFPTGKDQAGTPSKIVHGEYKARIL